MVPFCLVSKPSDTLEAWGRSATAPGCCFGSRVTRQRSTFRVWCISQKALFLTPAALWFCLLFRCFAVARNAWQVFGFSPHGFSEVLCLVCVFWRLRQMAPGACDFFPGRLVFGFVASEANLFMLIPPATARRPSLVLGAFQSGALTQNRCLHPLRHDLPPWALQTTPLNGDPLLSTRVPELSTNFVRPRRARLPCIEWPPRSAQRCRSRGMCLLTQPLFLGDQLQRFQLTLLRIKRLSEHLNMAH